MPTAVCRQIKTQPALVLSTVFFLIPLASSLWLSGDTLLFIYNGKMMPEIFTEMGGKCFNKTWDKTMTEVALSFKDKDKDKVKMSDRKVDPV